ncbi:hypothetical protein Vi05172_g6825 [Venturia inaequalis]|uniref:Uncharacterized protein n=1 Tax=Venturia inaequalis TaxID=5025 RepID=A0A8H3ZEY7_VENIN|nr:hypothetical protein EG327_002353 [Venturia inaequalis]RDI82961.1 hypothetical protein Vi05172_g6825 [Venturia inaequalis]
MAKEKPESKKEDKAKARQVPQNRRGVNVTLANGDLATRAIGPVGGVRKQHASNIAKFTWNTKALESKMGALKKGEPKGHYKGLSAVNKQAIKPMSFIGLPGELRNEIYPSLLGGIEGRILLFTNNPTGLVPGWPATVLPSVPIGLLSAGSKLIRGELRPLAYEKVDVHIRIVSGRLNSTDELHAWVNSTVAIPFDNMDITLLTKLSLTILLPCSFETVDEDQGINFKFLTRMAKLRSLRLRVQVQVPNAHMPPWMTLHTQVPDTTFSPFVTGLITSLFKHIPQNAQVEFGDGVSKEDGGLGTWVDDRADGWRDQGWMENPKIAENRPGSVRHERDTVAVPVPQAESVWGAFRLMMGSADAFTREHPVVVGDGEVRWKIGSGIGSVGDPVLIDDGDEDGDGDAVMEDAAGEKEQTL